jgi:hypothetical protein
MSFRSWRDYWDFAHEITREQRYIRSEKANAFLDEVAATSPSRIRELKKDVILWRAQLGHGWRHESQIDEEVPGAFPEERMKPLPDRAREGRVNAKGVPCLYLATTEDTAIAEVRPAVGSYVSTAQFEVTRDLKIMDCSVNAEGMSLYFEEPSEAEREKAVWNYIDRAFAEPTQPSEEVAEYVPTQVLAELFRTQGCDGVAYKSSLGKGYNVALFDLSAAELINCALYQVRGLTLDYGECDYRYFVGKRFKK